MTATAESNPIDPDLVPPGLFGDLLLALLPHYAEPGSAPE